MDYLLRREDRLRASSHMGPVGLVLGWCLVVGYGVVVEVGGSLAGKLPHGAGGFGIGVVFGCWVWGCC